MLSSLGAPLLPLSFRARPLAASLFGVPISSPEAPLAKILKGVYGTVTSPDLSEQGLLLATSWRDGFPHIYLLALSFQSPSWVLLNAGPLPGATPMESLVLEAQPRLGPSDLPRVPPTGLRQVRVLPCSATAFTSPTRTFPSRPGTWVHQPP